MPLHVKEMRTPQATQKLALLRVFVAFILACGFHEARAQSNRLTIDSYSLEYPSGWTYKVQSAPDGSQLHMFMGPQVSGAMAYCHTTQQPLQPTLAPRASKMNEKQRTEFFATADERLLFSLYNNLPSAQGFRLVHSGPSVLGKVLPSFSADFFFRVPQGFVYRVRSHYTFWKAAQLSIWCQTVSKSESASDDAFQANLPNFQSFVASVKLKQ